MTTPDSVPQTPRNTQENLTQSYNDPLPDLDALFETTIVMRSPYGIRGMIALRHVEALERLGWVKTEAE